MQIRSKLTLQFILIFAVILQISLFFIYFKFKKHLEDEFYDGLKSKAFMTAEMLVNLKDVEPNQEPLTKDSSGIQLQSKENFLIFNNANQIIFEFNQLNEVEISNQTLELIKKGGEYRFEHGKFKAIGIFYKNKYQKDYTIISEAIFNSTDLENLRNIIIIDFFLIIIILSASGWFFAGQALKPVTNIMNQIDKILPSDLSERLNTSGNKDELSRLTNTFNNLLDRIEYTFNLQKSFLSNISHELKNPLTVITSQLEVLLAKERSNEDYKKTLSSVLQDVKDLSVVTDQLMQLARIKNNFNQIKFEKIRIDELIWDSRDTLLKNNPQYKVNVDYEKIPLDSEKLYIFANEHLLKTALMNIFENGCKFSNDFQLLVKLSSENDKLLKIEIIDNGPGIADDEKNIIMTPFYRSPKNNKVKGSGVGLALVDSVLKLHDATLVISDNKPVGSVFTILLKSDFSPNNHELTS